MTHPCHCETTGDIGHAIAGSHTEPAAQCRQPVHLCFDIEVMIGIIIGEYPVFAVSGPGPVGFDTVDGVAGLNVKARLQSAKRGKGVLVNIPIGFLDATCGCFNRLAGLTSPGHALPLNGNNNVPHLMRGPF